MKYSYNTLVYGGEPIEQSIERIAGCGYDGVEFVGEPDQLDTEVIIEQLKRHNLDAAHICSIYTMRRDLVSSNEQVRRDAVTYVKSLVDFASQIGAATVGVTPTACMKIHAEADIEQEWAWAVQGIRDAGMYAAERGIRLVVEPWNRYETYLINRLAQSRQMVEDVGLDNVGCMGDTFHMNIEEEDIGEAFRATGDKLFYVHIGDSNRAAPGRGHIDFVPVLRALRDIGYDGYLSMELIPPAADPFPFLTPGGPRHEEFFDEYTRGSIDYLKKVAAEW